MHYVPRQPPIERQLPRQGLEERLREEVLPRIPATHWRELDDYPVFMEYRSPWAIAWSCLQHATGEPRTQAVYVLECLKGEEYQQAIPRYLETVGHSWEGKVDGAHRLVYVGKAQNLVKRLHQHLNSPGRRGANFTAVFPPVRVLDVSWYSSSSLAYRAEERLAELLRERFPEDYISQPG